MSSQANAGIPLASAPDGKGYRLFELPPELESLLTSPGAPVTYLRQPEDATSATLDVDGGKTYTLQQKNTSNGLFILTPTPSTAAGPDDIPQAPGLTVLATLHETIELVARAPTQEQKAKGKWHERFGKNR